MYGMPWFFGSNWEFRNQEETGREQGKNACDMSAIPSYEWAALAGSFT